MPLRRRPGRATAGLVLALVTLLTGCTSLSEYVQNGFKVGPDYCPPKAPVPYHWIDANDVRTEANPEYLCRWWTVFNDPRLNHLIDCAYRQNLSLKEAGLRVLQSRAALAITTGYIFPQSQTANGGYTRSGFGDVFSDNWRFGFNLSWELDFWGRYRRAIAAAQANLDVSVADYDGAIVTMLGDVAFNYILIRTDQEQIRLLRENARLQLEIIDKIERRLRAGWRQTTPLDLNQAVSTLKQTEAAIPGLEIDLRQAENRLCILLGMPAIDIQNLIGTGPIPTTPPEVVLGLPAELLRRRPDVRRAERFAASQAEQIGIAESSLYPAFSINGNLGYSAAAFADLFRSSSFNGSVGPSFNWNILNYGRLINGVRLQEAAFQEAVVAYQRTVITADREVEDGIITFLKAQQRTKLLAESVEAAQRARSMVVLQYQTGSVDFNRYAVIEQNLVGQQNALAGAQGQIAQGLVQIYRALGGGWEIKYSGPDATLLPPGAGPVGGPESPLAPQPPMPPSPAEAIPVPPAASREAIQPPAGQPMAPADVPPAQVPTPAVPEPSRS